ncbi:DNA polymerase III subunit [Anditalea andensis]|uniref:DNA polymerase III subunit gamma/tau n=1 Tax=Anditalea andensis TaxID=1048983 RepID=A0A074KYM7_9BACT|nr:DNA polymerase III subunit gamma/tau [Anditalea andensis]KEO73330.1 DNA polymerase III subunit gamma/tau [Anditalea andensis]
MLFSSIPGLRETKERLIKAIQTNHLAHALLFHGPEGSANLAMALALATYVNCQKPEEEDACGKCDSCLKMGKLIHPDVGYTFPVPGSLISDDDNKKKVDILSPWRSFVLSSPYGNLSDWNYHNGFDGKQLNISKNAAKQIIKTLSLKSFEGGYKIMLIWFPEYMHVTAANAILKILEEPPERTLFLMVSNQPDKLLTTILSRTQKVLVRAFRDEEIKDHFIASGISTPEAAAQIAPLADGSMREAFQLADQIQDENTVKFRDWMRICFGLEINPILTMSEEFASIDKEAQKALFLTGLTVLRESLLKRSQLDGLMRTAASDRAFIENFSLKALTEEKIIRIYDLLNQAFYHLERNASAKIIFTDLSLGIARVLRNKNI